MKPDSMSSPLLKFLFSLIGITNCFFALFILNFPLMLGIINKLIELLNNGSIYRFCALAGSGLLLIQIIMGFLGSDGEHDHDVFEDGKFKWMTKQALTGFIMMFGWVGLTCTQQFFLSPLSSVLFATGAGTVASLISSYIFHLARKAHSPGTVFRIEDAIGKEALVYHRIPKSGTGKITISLHNFTHEIDAYCEEEVPSFVSVQIIKKMDDKTVIVVPLK